MQLLEKRDDVFQVASLARTTSNQSEGQRPRDVRDIDDQIRRDRRRDVDVQRARQLLTTATPIEHSGQDALRLPLGFRLSSTPSPSTI